MITLYRRHLARCKFSTRKHKNCSCPIWAEGTVHGKHVRRSLDLRNWEAAVRLTREWEIHSPEATLTVSEAVDRYIKDAEARNLREGSILKYKQSAKDLKAELGNKPLRSVTVQDIRDLREGWTLSGTSMLKRLEMIRSFFRFCVDSGWASTNPAKAIKPPVVKQRPTLPFSDDQMKKIMAAVDLYSEHHPQSPKSTVQKLRAFILLMRYSGIRISDAVNLKRDRIKKGKLFLYSHKTNVPVWVPLKAEVLKALAQCENGRDYYFSTGNGKVKTWTTEWEERLKKVFVIAGIPEGHSHQLRDTFAVSLLLKGLSVENVAALLGNTSRIVEKHYSPWVQERQERLEELVKKAW